MTNIEHSHWERYHTRVVPAYALLLGDYEIKRIPEKLQLICIDDGKIFHEVEVTNLNNDI